MVRSEKTFTWKNYKDDWIPKRTPIVMMAMFSPLLALGAFSGMRDLTIAGAGLEILSFGMLAPRLFGTFGETVSEVADEIGVRITPAPWWKNIAFYATVGSSVFFTGLAIGVAKDSSGRATLAIPATIVGLALSAHMVYAIARSRRGVTIYTEEVVTPRGRTIHFKDLGYDLYDPPSGGAASVRLFRRGGQFGGRPEYVTSLGYLISPNNLLSLIDALSSRDPSEGLFTSADMRFILAISPPAGVPEGGSIEVSIPNR
ncbi:hypothetical protein [Tsukamurella paurometabola]|uniref:Uncharacterized protein n=1 Tax=Tsukamurella paurometabola TaxID=2061 RepID=A0A3P8LDS3_TSUPA|nr:hypothetical protein [Tsukamurella paurometabola]UEA81367.1 hypothetical protein LK411_13200 [Tsukamurella paurometabola]VDR38352.1 Uncharacterised protein [Tsukamurella paurometabola]